MGTIKKINKPNFKKADLSKFIEIIKTGSRLEIKEAKKQIESFWHNFYINNREEGREAFKQFLDEIKHFDDICDLDHQVDFIISLKWAVWTLSDHYFEILVDFILKCMEHPSGRIRQQTIHLANILTLGLELPRPQSIIKTKSGEVVDKMDKYKQLINLIKFGLYAYAIEELIDKYFQPKFKKYKYVSSLPVGEYKSLVKLLSEAVLSSKYFKINYDWFLLFFEGRVQRVYSGEYSLDLKLLLSLVEMDDCDVVDYIVKN